MLLSFSVPVTVSSELEGAKYGNRMQLKEANDRNSNCSVTTRICSFKKIGSVSVIICKICLHMDKKWARVYLIVFWESEYGQLFF